MKMDYEKAMEVIRQICERLNVAAVYLVPKLAVCRIVEDAVGIIFALAITIASAWIAKWAFKEMREKHMSSQWDMWPGVTALTASLVAVIAAVILASTTADIATWIAAPEVKAIEYIIKMVNRR